MLASRVQADRQKQGRRKEVRTQARKETKKQGTKSKLESNTVSTLSIARHFVRSKQITFESFSPATYQYA